MRINPYKMQLAKAFKDLFRPARYKVFYGGRGGGNWWGSNGRRHGHAKARR